MISHLAVQNNPFSTQGLPSSCSKRIIQDLLIDSLGFKGVIVTDAMNMGAIRSVDKPELKALEAGAHLILMPRSPKGTYNDIISKMNSDPEFRNKVRSAGMKVLDLKKAYQEL